MGFFSVTTDNKAVGAILTSDVVFTSALRVQAYQRVNIEIVIGSQVSDILSWAAPSAALSAPASTCSAVITLQRRMRELTGFTSAAAYHWTWRDIDEWAVVVADKEDASVEEITTQPEPEPAEYRIGIKTGDFQSGVALARIGTSGS